MLRLLWWNGASEVVPKKDGCGTVGTFRLPVRFSSMDGQRSTDIEAIVDTGAAFTVLPDRILRDLGVAPSGRRRFALADGRWTTMEFGWARASIDSEQVITIVAFGDDNGPSLLGAYTLEGMALAVDPVQQRLVPAELFL